MQVHAEETPVHKGLCLLHFYRTSPGRLVYNPHLGSLPVTLGLFPGCRLWTVKELEEWANDFVTKHYENSASMLQLRFIEREFWKEFLLRQNKSVRYASDVPGTVFDDWEALGRSKWNLGVSTYGALLRLLYLMLFSMLNTLPVSLGLQLSFGGPIS